VTVRHGSTTAVDGVDLDLHQGDVVALMGRNGAGKSSLLWALQGSGRRTSGSVRLADGAETAALDPVAARSRITLLPQPASDLLYLADVASECAAADGGSGRARAELDALVPGIADETDPRDLSEGGRLALALAVQLSADAEVVLLDEPTRGLDAVAKAALSARLRELAEQGRAVVVTTHDVEFAATCANRVVVLAGGEVVADGVATDVLRASPMLAPQVAKVLPHAGVLTVADVATRLARGGGRDG
jgi:energy-coupling factor transport system ATP-binding protein